MDPRLTRITAYLLVFLTVTLAVIDALALNPSSAALWRKYPYPTALGVLVAAALITVGLAVAWTRVRAALGVGSARQGAAGANPRVRAGRLPLEVALPALLLLILVVVLVAIITRDALWTTGTAAVATMVVLAYQGWQVQESTAIGAQAIAIGQAAGIEAEKRRLDNRASTIHLSIGSPAWPPGGARPRTVYRGDETTAALVPGTVPEQLDEGHIYRLPKNADDLLSLWVEGQVKNEGPRTVEVRLRGVRTPVEGLAEAAMEVEGNPTLTWSEPGSFSDRLAPGRKAFFRLEGARPVSDWVANHRALLGRMSARDTSADAADPVPTAVIEGEVVVDDGFDNGVTDTWQITLGGCPLQPVPDEDASWQIRRSVPERLPIVAELSMLRRTYWRSKERRLELPSLEI